MSIFALSGASVLDQIAALDEADQAALLELLRRYPGIATGDIATNVGWVSSKVHRLLKSLEKDKLVRRRRKKWAITEAGEAELNRAQRQRKIAEATDGEQS